MWLVAAAQIDWVRSITKTATIMLNGIFAAPAAVAVAATIIADTVSDEKTTTNTKSIQHRLCAHEIIIKRDTNTKENAYRTPVSQKIISSDANNTLK